MRYSSHFTEHRRVKPPNKALRDAGPGMRSIHTHRCCPAPVNLVSGGCTIPCRFPWTLLASTPTSTA